VIAAAQAGEARAAAAVDEVAGWCGVGIRAVVNLFNPQVVVLGGALAQVWRAAEDRVQATIARSTMTDLREDVVIRAARLEDESPLIGAAELAFAPVLEFPQDVAQGA
jgi:predicted NBD/HSP70 family sugar kinase